MSPLEGSRRSGHREYHHIYTRAIGMPVGDADKAATGAAIMPDQFWHTTLRASSRTLHISHGMLVMAYQLWHISYGALVMTY